MQTKLFQSKSSEFNEKERSIVHYISTKNVDAYNEIILPEGMDDSRFKAVLWNHSYGISMFNPNVPPPSALVIGKSLWRVADDYGIKAKTKFADTPLGNDVMNFNKEGYINSWSIGFQPVKKDKDEKSGITTISKWFLYEYSSVIFPANNESVNLMLKDCKDLSIKQAL